MPKKKLFTFILIILVIIAGLLIWETFPEKSEKFTLNYSHNISELMISQACAQVEYLLEQEWEIEYPEKIAKNDKDLITVSLIESTPIISEKLMGDDDKCNLVVEVLFDLSPATNQPDIRIFEPYKTGNSMRFQEEIYSSNEKITGIIWIFLNVYGQETEQNRIPMFSIPIHIRVESWAGVSPSVFRMSAVAALILLSSYYLWISLRNRK